METFLANVDPVLAAAAVGLFGWAAATDVAARRIPNRITGLLALAGLARVVAAVAADGAWGAAAWDLGAATAVFALGAAAFRFGLLGGGDVKLLAAGALWLGAGDVWPFLATTALVGGGLAALYLLRVATARSGPAAPRPSLPYGVAIAAGGVLATLAGFA